MNIINIKIIMPTYREQRFSQVQSPEISESEQAIMDGSTNKRHTAQ